jgi:hypothetical protein
VKRTRHAVLLTAACAFASAALAAPAQATLTITSFTITPSTTQAGGSSTSPGPNLTVDAAFGTSNGDSPKDLTLALAPGLLANPSVATLCTGAQFSANSCPTSSQVGSGTVTGTAPSFGTTINLPASVYLIQPTGSEIARLGIIATFFDYPVATISAPVAIRQTPTFGINLPITGLPNSIDGTQVIINGLHLVLPGQVNNKPFTRNPTSCAAASSTMTADSYGAPTTNVAQSTAFTPTGCSGLPYAPTIAGTAALDSADDGLAVTATITQKYEESDNQTVNLIMPFSLSPRLSVLSTACTNADVTTCPAIATATITTPLLANPITANVALISHPNAIPTLAINIPPPIGITLTATPVLTGQTVQALVTNIPDIPLSGLQLNLPGGSNSLFRAGTHFCTVAQTFGANFTGWSGASTSPTSAATISGCPATSAATVNSAPVTSSALTTTGSSGSTASDTSTNTATAPTGQASFSGLATDHAKVQFAVGTPRQTGGLRSISVRLPKGLSIHAAALSRNLTVKLDGKRVATKYTLRNGVLTITFAKAGRVAFVTITSPALTVTKSSAAQVRQHKAGKLTLEVTVRNVNGRSATLSLRSNAR